MFSNLSDKLSNVLLPLKHRKLTESNIKDAMREVRTALLDADVAFSVVLDFVQTVQQKAIGQTVARQTQPGDAFIKIVHESLVEIMGGTNNRLDLDGGSRPNVVLMAGLQGVGKTTTAIKLAKLLKEREEKQVAVVSADVYRPAALEQLEILAGEAGVRCISSNINNSPEKIVMSALKDSQKQFDEVLVVDTAGRLTIDDTMMAEITTLHKVLQPRETLFVVDAMTGQDAANTAKAFQDALPLTGVILAKADADTRGGAALSVRSVLGKPIKFIGTGEGIDSLEPFHPDRIASRILGMGDVLSYLEEAERKLDHKKAQRLGKKIVSGRKFNLEDMRDQLSQFVEMGGRSSMLDMLPNLGSMNAKIKDVDEAEIQKQCVIIDSMTSREKLFPNLVNNSPSRKRRIASGSGTRVQDVNLTLRKFQQLEKQMKRMGRKKHLTRAMAAMNPEQLKMK
ncbi:MAG: signal recognition particle protein [Gammaproteobacteria bacterium]|nr:signal recognition particle protein [Gammaproteobacteria bacterium]MYF03004.1 signal recognition particle protein [Gammaproteobacteria bacterium]MYI76529.1 signal recognition particle protein [Gammaproteobacteria bacterium]